jgi:hypothetical protein
MSEILVAVHVHSASRLPKTDLIGSIDPYIRALVDLQNRIARTQTIKNSPEPVWNELIVLPATVDLTNPGGTLKLELWDEDMVDDEAVGFVEVPLADLILNRRVSLQSAPFQLLPQIKPNKAGPALLNADLGYILDQSALRALLDPLRPGIIDEPRRRLLIPVFELSDGAYLEVCYPFQASRTLSVAVLSTRPDPTSHYEFLIEGTLPFAVDQRPFPTPQVRSDALHVFHEARLNDISPTSDLTQISLQHTYTRTLHRESAAAPLTERGLRDRLTFEAVQSLAARFPEIKLNASARCANIPYRYTHLLLDFSTDPVTIAIERYTDPSRTGLAYDLSLASGHPIARRRHCRHPNRTALRAHDHLQALDLPPGSTLSDIVIEEQFLDQPRRGALLDLLPLWG